MALCAKLLAILTTTVDNSKNQGNSEYDTDGGKNTQDKLFLLSNYDAFDLNFSIDEARLCALTDCAIAQGAMKFDNTDAGCWWLRSTGFEQDVAAGIAPYNGREAEADFFVAAITVACVLLYGSIWKRISSVLLLVFGK